MMQRQSKSIRTIRRSELSRAAFEAVVRYGLRGTTLERVGEIAGVSKGVVRITSRIKARFLRRCSAGPTRF